MAKIYVSSTFLDLKDHREQVERVIRRMGHTDVAMEYYVAEDKRPVAKCLDDVAACDVYVGIFAWRYGWIPTENNSANLSITEMEFRQAEDKHKPCLIFLLSDDAPWARSKMDRDTTKIEALRNTASAKHNADYFTTPDELARKVAEAIYKLLPAAVSIPEHNLGAYFNALRKRYGALALEGLTPPQKEEYLQIQLRQVFVEQNVRENPPPVELPKEVWEKLSRDKEIHSDDLPSGITLDDARRAREAYYEKPARPVLDVLTDSRYPHAIILGDPGSGKSTLARYVMLSLMDSTLTPALSRLGEGVLPLLIELRSYAGLCAEGNCTSFLEFLEFLGKTEGWALTQAALHNHLKTDGRAVVLFDGLDEIFDPEQRERITRQIVGFAGDYPKARIIVTSRVIGYRRKILTDAGFTHFTLQDLDEKQVETFVSRWYDLAMSDRPDEAKERRERILKSFKESASIRQLAGNPMLLTIMAIIGKHQELPRERWKLYDHAASVLIQHWDVNKHLKDARIDADFIGEDDKKELLRRLAFRMQSGDGGLAGNYIHRGYLQEEFENYLRERYAQTPDRAVSIARAMIEQFRERNFILSLYGANLYGFVHRAFLEFFCASAFVYKFEKTKELTIEQLKIDVYGKHWEDQSWHEVLRLICGMVDEKFAEMLIEHLANQVFPDWCYVSSYWSSADLLPVHIPLALQCLGEVHNLSSIEKDSTLVIQRCCDLFDFAEPGIREIGDHLKPLAHVAEEWNRDLPNVDLISEWMMKRKPNSTSRFQIRSFGLFVGKVSKGSQAVYKAVMAYRSNYHWEHRILVPSLLVNGWLDHPDTFSILCDMGANDPNGEVRRAAVTQLSERFNHDPRTFSFLCERVIQDWNKDVGASIVSRLAQQFHCHPDLHRTLLGFASAAKQSLVRRTAVQQLAQQFRDDPSTLSLLYDFASNDKVPYVRGTAVEQLAQQFHNRPETLRLLHEFARAAKHPYVRRIAVEQLAQQYYNHYETFSMLIYCASYDVSPKPSDKHIPGQNFYVRQSAINAIAKTWPNHPDTIILLRERAENDPNLWLREHAKNLVVAIEQGKPIDEIVKEE